MKMDAVCTKNKAKHGVRSVEPSNDRASGNDRQPSLHQEQILNSIVAGVLLTLCLPLMLAVGLFILIVDGWPVVYRGTRLGKNKVPFVLYKFRTLKRDAERQIGTNLMSNQFSSLMIPCGQFLRDTRLDELPQLWNILRGDMSFIGPRPERPIIYESICANINSYDLRFSVKPGVFGYSQIYTPHGTPKRLRAFLDNHYNRQKQSLMGEAWFFLKFCVLIGFAAAKKACVESRKLGAALVPFAFPKRLIPKRVCRKKVLFETNVGGHKLKHEAFLVDLDENRFRMLATHLGLPEREENTFVLEVLWKEGRGRKFHKRCRCTGKVVQIIKSDCGYEYHVQYKPMSSLGEYMIQQYFLRTSIVPH